MHLTQPHEQRRRLAGRYSVAERSGTEEPVTDVAAQRRSTCVVRRGFSRRAIPEESLAEILPLTQQ